MKILIPEDLSEITLDQYLKFEQVRQNSEDSAFEMLQTVSIFCKIPLKKVTQMTVTDLEDTFKLINRAFEKKRRFKNRFTLEGKEYGFIPSLDEMTYGEFIDLNNYLGEAESLNKLMAVLYRPITKKAKDTYDIEEYQGSDKYSHIMRQAPLDVVLEAQVFFYRLGIECSLLIAGYLEKQAKNLTTQEKEALVKSGVGIKQFTQSLKETSYNLIRLSRKEFMSA